MMSWQHADSLLELQLQLVPSGKIRLFFIAFDCPFPFHWINIQFRNIDFPFKKNVEEIWS